MGPVTIHITGSGLGTSICTSSVEKDRLVLEWRISKFSPDVLSLILSMILVCGAEKSNSVSLLTKNSDYDITKLLTFTQRD